MSTEIHESGTTLDEVHQSLQALTHWQEAPDGFWTKYANALAVLSHASHGVILRQVGGQDREWRKTAEYSARGGDARARREFIGQLKDFAERCAHERGVGHRPAETGLGVTQIE